MRRTGFGIADIGRTLAHVKTTRELCTFLKGIRFAHAIFRLPPPAPSHMGGGSASPKFGEPPDGGEKLLRHHALL